MSNCVYKLLLLDTDQDVIIISGDSCVTCYNHIHNNSVLRTYDTSETIAKEIVTFSRQRPISFKCRRLCVPLEQITPGSADHFLRIANETTRYSDLHWVICRQVQRRRNKRWMSIHDHELLELPTWYYVYFDEYVSNTIGDITVNKFRVNFQEENKANHTRKTEYTK